MKTGIEEIIENYLNANPGFRSTLKDEQGLIDLLIRNNNFVIREDQLVNPQTNETHPVGSWIQSHSRPFLKTVGSGRYLGKYRDTRTDNDKINNAEETRDMLKGWIERKGYAFIADEPVRIWIDQLSKSMIHESDGEDSFVLTPLINGIGTNRLKPEELFPLIGQYVDPEKTRLNELRRNAKISAEAFNLSGLSSQDLSDERKSAYHNEIEGLLKKEFFAQHTKKKLPNISTEELISDLEKEIAYSWGLPMERKAWSLAEKTSLKAIAEDAITEAQTKAIAPIQKYVSDRPANFFEKVIETYNGLPNNVNE